MTNLGSDHARKLKIAEELGIPVTDENASLLLDADYESVRYGKEEDGSLYIETGSKDKPFRATWPTPEKFLKELKETVDYVGEM